MDFYFFDANLPFMIAIALLIAIMTLELIGAIIGLSFIDMADPDIDADVGFLDSAFNWLGLGRVPLLVFLAIFFGTFGIAGLTFNYVSFRFLGTLWPTLISIPVALLVAIPVTAKLSTVFARILPRDETNSIHTSSLVGKTGTITSGSASKTTVAFASVYDDHHTQHTVRVYSLSDEAIPTNSKITLVSYSDQGFFYATKI